MRKKKLSFISSIFVSSLLFGLFFGAGNLILPVQVGQNSGNNFIFAITGFIFTAAGLPFLAVAAFGTSRTKDVYSLATKIHPIYAKILTILLYLTIGPLFALPRTCTVAFEVGFANMDNNPIYLFIFSLIFFAVALYFSLKPNKILIWVGKILNPIFLVFFFFLFINAIISPMGPISSITSQMYQSQPFLKGFREGYQTMDILAALAFGSIITRNILSLGIEDDKRVSFETIKSGLLSSTLMGVIYLSLAWLGSTALNVLPTSKNGGIALSRISNYYFGNLGSLFLAITVTIACLKTAVGLITACSDIFITHLPFKKISLKQYTVIITVFTAIIANFGLEKLIDFAVPVLMFLYPLCITLTILGLLFPWIEKKHSVFVFSSIGAGIMALLDMLNASPDIIRNLLPIKIILDFSVRYIPFFTIGMSWVIPMFMGFILGFIIDKIKNNNRKIIVK